MAKILSIDDSKAVHSFLNMCFENKKIQLDHAYNGEEGLSKIFPESSYDLILLDWEMPGLTGPEVLKKIREGNNQTPVMMLTSKNEPSEIEQVLNLGANEFVMKPFSAEILIDKIETVLNIKIDS